MSEVAYCDGWSPGIAGDLLRLQAIHYARDWGFGPVFESRVAAGLAEFLPRCDQNGSRLISARRDGIVLGGLAIDGADPAAMPGQAHLRWFILADAARGAGIGGRLMERAMQALSAGGFTTCWLDTFAGLDAARRLYGRHGFTLVRETAGTSWGRPVTEQRFEWHAR
jgi:ribosomal protein S18 acetylase RimI-like enzyme